MKAFLVRIPMQPSPATGALPCYKKRTWLHQLCCWPSSSHRHFQNPKLFLWQRVIFWKLAGVTIAEDNTHTHNSFNMGKLSCYLHGLWHLFYSLFVVGMSLKEKHELQQDAKRESKLYVSIRFLSLELWKCPGRGGRKILRTMGETEHQENKAIWIK